MVLVSPPPKSAARAPRKSPHPAARAVAAAPRMPTCITSSSSGADWVTSLACRRPFQRENLASWLVRRCVWHGRRIANRCNVCVLMGRAFKVERVGRGESRGAHSGLPDRPTFTAHLRPRRGRAGRQLPPSGARTWPRRACPSAALVRELELWRGSAGQAPRALGGVRDQAECLWIPIRMLGRARLAPAILWRVRRPGRWRSGRAPDARTDSGSPSLIAPFLLPLRRAP